jgi:chromosome segregation ATPase
MRDEAAELETARADLDSVSRDLADFATRREAAAAQLADAESGLTTLLDDSRVIASEHASLTEEIAEKTEELALVQTSLDASQADLAAVNATQVELAKLEDQRNQVRSELQTISADLDSGNQNLADIQTAIDAKTSELAELSGTAKATAADLAQQTSELARRESDAAALVAKISDREAELDALVQQTAAARANFEAQDELSASWRAEQETVASQLEEAQQQILAIEAEVSRLKIEESALRDEYAASVQRRDAVLLEARDLEAGIAEAEVRVAEMQSESGRLQEDVQTMSARIRSEEDILVDLEKAKSERQAEIAELDAEILMMRAGAEKARSDFAVLTDALARIGAGEAIEQAATAVEPTTTDPVGSDTPVVAVSTDDEDRTASGFAEPRVAGVRTTNPASAPSRDLIRQAIAAAPGLSQATSPQLALLTSELEQGVCPVHALDKVFGEVNRQTLVALVREIGPC